MRFPHRPPPDRCGCPLPRRPYRPRLRGQGRRSDGPPPRSQPSAAKAAEWCACVHPWGSAPHSAWHRPAAAGEPAEAVLPAPPHKYRPIYPRAPAAASEGGCAWPAVRPALCSGAGWKGRWAARPAWRPRPRRARKPAGQSSARPRPPAPPHCRRRARGRHTGPEWCVCGSAVPAGWPARIR